MDKLYNICSSSRFGEVKTEGNNNLQRNSQEKSYKNHSQGREKRYRGVRKGILDETAKIKGHK